MHWDLDQLTALSAAVSEGSFDAAAARLNVTPSAISQRIKALEGTVGQILLVRSRPIRATAPGITLLRTARQIEALTDDAARDLGAAPDQLPAVTIAVNADSLAIWLIPALAAVDPPVLCDLRRADETRTTELLRDGTVNAAVTTSPDPIPGCVTHPLGSMRYRPRAASRFAQRWFPAGVTPDALANAPVVVFDRSDELQDRYLTRRARQALNPPRHYIPGSEAFYEAIRAGLGWGMVPDLQTRDGDGLVPIDPLDTLDVTLHWQQWRLQSDAFQRVTAAISAEATNALEPAPDAPKRK